jgi:hypothetical protein
MKYKLVLGACSTLLPVLVAAQTPQVKDCKTLEAAGNYIGADEEFVDGKVCKVVKAKPAVTNAAPGEAVPETNMKVPPQGSTIPEKDTPAQNATFEPDHALSVADIARAYRKPPRKPLAKAPEGAAPASDAAAVAKDLKPTAPTPDAPLAAVATKARPTAPMQPAVPATATETQPKPEIKIESAPVPGVPAKTPAAEVRPATTTSVPEPRPTPEPVASAPVKAAATQSSVPTPTPEAQPKPEIKIESAPGASIPGKVPATQTQPATTAPAPETQLAPEVKIESNPAASVPPIAPVTEVQPAAPMLAPETNKETQVPQQEPKTGTFDQQEVAKEEVKPEVQQALPESMPAEEERPREVKTGGFVAPKETGEAMPTVVDPFGAPAEDAGIQEPRPGCKRVVSLGSMQVDRLVLGTPDWAAKWLEKNQKRFPGVCFADSPLEGVPSFLIVFSIVARPTPVGPPRTSQTVQALAPTKMDASASTSEPPKGGTYTTSFGSTWHYSYDNAATTTVTTAFTETIPHNFPVQVISATAYSEEGIPISQHWPTAAAEKGREKEPSHSRGRKQEPLPLAVRLMIDLLEQMMADIIQR